MANGNTVTLVGNITRDPELRFTNTGQATASFGLAVNRRWQNRQTQEWEEATSFIDVVCWREMAENAAESLTRGARVLVTGRLEQRSWETPDGDKRSRIELIADVVLVLVVELLNTAIEKLADRLTTDHDPQIGRVKDMGSAAVGVALVMAGLFWVFAIAERIGAI